MEFRSIREIDLQMLRARARGDHDEARFAIKLGANPYLVPARSLMDRLASEERIKGHLATMDACDAIRKAQLLAGIEPKPSKTEEQGE